MYAISHNGETMWVATLDGHEGCTVIAENVEPSPDPCAMCPVTGNALVDAVAKEDARINAMSNVELVAHIMGLLAP